MHAAAERPLVFPKVPAGHGVGELEPDSQKLPGGQGVTVLRFGQYEPASQAMEAQAADVWPGTVVAPAPLHAPEHAAVARPVVAP